MNKVYWTEKRDEKLLKLKDEGKSWEDIAKKFKGKTVEACKSRLKALKKKGSSSAPKKAAKKAAKKSTSKGIPDFGEFWTSYKLSTLYNLKDEGFSFEEIAKTLRCDEEECAEVYASVDWDEFKEDPANKEFIQTSLFNDDIYKSDREIYEESIAAEKLRLSEKTERIYLEQLKKERAKTELIIDAIKDAVYKVPKIEPKLRTPKAAEPDEEDMGLMLSDIHIGQNFTFDDTNDISEYNMEIYEQRLQQLNKSVVSIASKHMHLYPIPCLHVFALGDIVHGMNTAGAWGPQYTETDVVNQMFRGVNTLMQTLIEWTNVFPKIKFYGVYGNHGRGAKKGEKEIVNWDYILYQFLKQGLSQYDNIEFELTQSWWNLIEIRNHKFVITHGDDMKGFMGLPFYGMVRYERRLIGMIKNFFHYMLLGHHHRNCEIETNSGSIISNGSFVGGDVFSTKKLQSSATPSQRTFGIHDKRGITWQYIVDLTEK